MKSIQQWSLLIILLSIMTSKAGAQAIPELKVLAIEELADYLKPEKRNQLKTAGEITNARLAKYFRQSFSKRFFYDHKTLANRLANYNKL